MQTCKTKIIFTVGPATMATEVLTSIITSGANVCRLNMAHADADWTHKVVRNLREAEAATGRKIALMMDIKGPEIRTSKVEQDIVLKKGDRLRFVHGPEVATRDADGTYVVGVNYGGLAGDVRVGDLILVDSGLIRMRIRSADASGVLCEVEIPGTLGSRRHINLPGVHVNLPALTEKDLRDVELGIDVDVDFFALSFVRQAEDVHELRDTLEAAGSAASIISKIEDQQGIRNIEAIIDASDAIMVARGDLGIECPYEQLPIIQKQIVNACITAGKPVIVATHMLESMTDSPIPSRAEVSDVSNAVYEEADCIMLSGETTVGKYPVECVQTMRRIAGAIEAEIRHVPRTAFHLDGPRSKLLSAAAHLAEELKTSIMVFTRRGFYAKQLSSLRPKFPIYAFTDQMTLYRQLQLVRGIQPFFIEFQSVHFEGTIRKALSTLREQNLGKPGQPLVVITKAKAEGELHDTVQLRFY
jgi:pyruvate kinase